MAMTRERRFELRKVTATEWLVLDHRYVPTDPRQTIARVYVLDENEVAVTWLRDLPLRLAYQTPFDVLEDVQRFYRRARSQRPISIPHRPPLAASA